MSLRPSAIAEEQAGSRGLYVVIDDPDTAEVLLIPCSFEHRRVLTREQYEAEGRFEVHPSQISPDPSDRDRGLREWLRSDEASDLLARRIYEYSEQAEGATWPVWTDLSEKSGWLAVAGAFLVALADAAPTSSQEGTEG